MTAHHPSSTDWQVF